ncbi:isochorismate synthase [Actinokineospora sp. NBRC 105648]|uniref:isochorismate synthase n=1 Tax=Actinokineospora sp. NBRC 105648 TaxID=3032206 RepID=UPI0024A2A2ED|nr:isochorismate synthase [Actinokineospora sp. NBRC 105648]GLZ39316.1 isochorismate synthase DhbC [Actinokineospora sp. NBRC 105648]
MPVLGALPAEALSTDLVADYREGAFLFAAPSGVLLAEGERAVLRSPAEAVAVLERDEIVVGAVPFDPSAPSRLVIPRTVRRGAPLTTRPRPSVSARWLSQHTDAEAYRDGVRRALELMAGGALRKVVLARRLDLVAAEPVDVTELVAALAARDPRGHTFAAPLDGRTLVGTSPELLIRRTGRLVLSNPLAGSRPRSEDPVLDGRHATELLGSAKDRREHELVVSAVADALAPFCRELTVPTQPELLPTRSMWHLSTRVSGVLADADTTALELATALHPTPAVCGAPTERARRVIADLEPFDRGYYTGVVGWSNAQGDGEWVVTIRCGEVAGPNLRLYAGAGLVPGSDPDAELAETGAKLRTFLGALGVEEPA